MAASADQTLTQRGHWLRALANWLNLSTPLGLAIAAAGRARVTRGPDRVWVAEDYQLGFPKAGAFTVGSVILVPGGSLAALVERYPQVVEHELSHARQWAFCLGLPFLPLYLLASGWSNMRTGTHHGANFFELNADLAKGGYRAAAKRPIRLRKFSGR